MAEHESLQQIDYANSLRPYPLDESATLVSDDGVEMPFGVLADAMLVATYTDNLDGKSRPWLSSIYVGTHLVSVTFMIDGKDVAACTAAIDSLVPYAPVEVTPLSDGVSGTVAFADFQRPTFPLRMSFSSPQQTGLADSAFIRVPAPGVLSFVDDNSGERLQGDTKILMPRGSMVSETTSGIRVEMDETLNASLVPSCYPSDINMVCETPVVRSVNGIPADRDGIIAIRFA